MKKIRYIIAAMLFTNFALLSAQESMTSKATNGVFGISVDDFMNVTSFMDVNAQKLFMFSNFDSSKANFGLAKKFGSFYAALSLDGWFTQIANTTQTSTAEDGTIYTATYKGYGYPVSATDISTNLFANAEKYIKFPEYYASNELNAGLLFGFGNFGIKQTFSFTPNYTYAPASYSVHLLEKTSTGTNEYSIAAENFSIKAQLEAGTKVGNENSSISPSARIFLSNNYSNSERFIKTDTQNIRYFDNSGDYQRYGLGANLGIFKKKDNVSHFWDFDAEGSFNLYPKCNAYNYNYDTKAKENVINAEKNHFELSFDTSYKTQFDFTEKFTLATQLLLDSYYENTKTEPTFIDDVQQDYAVSTANFTLSPDFILAAQWKPLPQKLTINLSSSIGFGNLVSYYYYSEQYTQARNNWTFAKGTVALSLKSGVSLYLAQNILLDSSFNIFVYHDTLWDDTRETNTPTIEGIWKEAIKFQLSFML